MKTLTRLEARPFKDNAFQFMLLSFSTLCDYKCYSVTGTKYLIEDFIHNILSDRVEYCSIDLGRWLTAKHILFSTEHIRGFLPESQVIQLDLTDIDLETTSTSLNENKYSLQSLLGFNVAGIDGKLGSVTDFILNTRNWQVSDIVVALDDDYGGGRVLVPFEWLESFRYDDGAVQLKVRKQKVSICPIFVSTQPVNKTREVRVYDYYGRLVGAAHDT